MIFNVIVIFDQNDRIYESLNEIPWYSMRLSEQKALAHSLHHLQNGASLKIGSLNTCELNFVMASTVSILKSPYIYSRYKAYNL